MKSVYACILIIAAALCAAAAGLAAGYARVRPDDDSGPLVIADSAQFRAAIQTPAPTAASRSVFSAADDIRIGANTKLVYEYYYTEDGRLEKSVQDPPYYIVGMTRGDVSGLLGDWELVEFSTDQVVMRRNIQSRGIQNYILGIENGHVAVFYDEIMNTSSLREVTETPVNALAPEERERLSEGIRVRGYDRLIRLLEDYGS